MATQSRITRRDFLNGTLLGLGSLIMPPMAYAKDPEFLIDDDDYPPLRTEMRGSHKGSFETAHKLAWAKQKDWGPVADLKENPYDLVVVGAGISGLAAARLKVGAGDPYIHHFPDGNASIARLLVRKLIPQVEAAGKSMEDISLARFEYGQLDNDSCNVRICLNSTVVNAVHDGSPKKSEHVLVTYVRGGKAFRVRARNCVLACYNMMIPHIASEPRSDA